MEEFRKFAGYQEVPDMFSYYVPYVYLIPGPGARIELHGWIVWQTPSRLDNEEAIARVRQDIGMKERIDPAFVTVLDWKRLY